MPGPRRHDYLVHALILAIAGCAKPQPIAPDPGREAVRVSMALRGIPPTAAELSSVRADPKALDALTDRWLDDPAFVESVVDWHAELLWLRHDTQPSLPALGPLEGRPIGEIGASVAEAPLQLVAHVVAEGRAYSDLFEGRQVAVDANTSEIWGLPFDDTGPDWQIAEWSDERPAGGILVDSNLWMRHISSDTNHHRARANLVHRAWLCEDLSARTIEVGDVDLSDADAVSDAVRNDPNCTGCHETLDPLAASFAGWQRYIVPAEVREAWDAGCPDPDFCYPLGLWSPSAVPSAGQLGLPDAALAGRSVTDLAELGRALVADPRFATCVARQYAGWVGQSDPSEIPTDEAERLGRIFADSDFDLRVLARAVVRSERFSAHGGDVGPLIARPEQIARTVRERTGFTWTADPDAGTCPDFGCWGSVDLVTNARWGFRDIAGGIDGYDSRHPVHASQPLRHLAVQRLAEEAGAWVVVHEAGLPASQRRLLREIELDQTGDRAVQAQLTRLHERILGEPADPTDVAAAYGLWSAVHGASGSTERAWAVVIAAMLQAPELGVY